jgi:hypothetical protein
MTRYEFLVRAYIAVMVFAATAVAFT